jgi:hypothetical protein
MGCVGTHSNGNAIGEESDVKYDRCNALQLDETKRRAHDIALFRISRHAGYGLEYARREGSRTCGSKMTSN